MVPGISLVDLKLRKHRVQDISVRSLQFLQVVGPDLQSLRQISHAFLIGDKSGDLLVAGAVLELDDRLLIIFQDLDLCTSPENEFPGILVDFSQLDPLAMLVLIDPGLNQLPIDDASFLCAIYVEIADRSESLRNRVLILDDRVVAVWQPAVRVSIILRCCVSFRVGLNRNIRLCAFLRILDLVDVHVKPDHIVLCGDGTEVLHGPLIFLADSEGHIQVLSSEVESLRCLGLDQFVSSIRKILFRRKWIAVHVLAGWRSNDSVLICSERADLFSRLIGLRIDYNGACGPVDQVELSAFKLCLTLNHISVRGNLVCPKLCSGLVSQGADLLSKLQVLFLGLETSPLRNVLMRIRL